MVTTTIPSLLQDLSYQCSCHVCGGVGGPHTQEIEVAVCGWLVQIQDKDFVSKELEGWT